MFNEEMLSVKKLLEHIMTKALISGVYEYSLWERLYTLLIKISSTSNMR
jgi:hypothetical protein